MTKEVIMGIFDKVSKDLGFRLLGAPSGQPKPLMGSERQIGSDRFGIGNPDDEVAGGIFGVKTREGPFGWRE
jgi:hypothetical protein